MRAILLYHHYDDSNKIIKSSAEWFNGTPNDLVVKINESSAKASDGNRKIIHQIIEIE